MLPRLLLAAVYSLLTVGVSYAQGGELLWDNGDPQAIPYPNSMAHGSWSSWHLYDDFSLDQDTVITKIVFSVWHASSSLSVRAQYIIADAMTPKGKWDYQVGVPYRNPGTTTTTPNGRTMYSYTTWYTGYDVTMSDLNLTLAEGGHVLGVGVLSPSGTLGGFSWAGGPDTPRQPGLTCFRQRNNDGSNFDYCKSGAWAFKIYGHAVNTAPIADAGDDFTARAGTPVTLDGGGSSDDLTDPEDLVYTWQRASAPAGSAAVLAGADTANPSFFADASGQYVLGLVVTDAGGLSSDVDEVVVTANFPPLAVAGPDQLVIVGDVVTVDGSGSADPEGDSLAYAWTLDSAPAGSTAALASPDAAVTAFVPDVVGWYQVGLAVSDLLGAGVADAAAIEAVTASELARRRTVEAMDLVSGLGPDQVTTGGNQTALLAFHAQVTDALARSQPAQALAALAKAAERVDGCALRGQPDVRGPAQDWITDCAAQAGAYALVMDAMGALQ